MKLDEITEYRAMRTGLMALRLEVHHSVVDDLLLRCERACAAVRTVAVEEGRRIECEHRAGMPG